jgi:hypothetical protein
MTPDEEHEQPIAPRWAPRVPRWKIARLYESEARGLLDEDLVEDVAFAFFERCQSMIAAEEAHRGRATCPVCSGTVEHEWDKQPELLCAGCGWKGQWREYWKSYKGKRLNAAGLEPFCQDYIKRYPRAETAQEKMLLVDWLLHRFHWEGREGLPGRPGAVGLIGGSAHEVNTFLDALNLGDDSHPEIRASHASWQSVMQDSRAARRQKWEAKARGRAEKQQRREAKRKRRAERVQQRAQRDAEDRAR